MKTESTHDFSSELHHVNKARKHFDALSVEVLRPFVSGRHLRTKRHVKTGANSYETHLFMEAHEAQEKVVKRLTDRGLSVDASQSGKNGGKIIATSASGDKLTVCIADGCIKTSYTLAQRPNWSVMQRFSYSITKYPITIVLLLAWWVTTTLFCIVNYDLLLFRQDVLTMMSTTTSVFPLLSLLIEDYRYGRKNKGYRLPGIIGVISSFAPRVLLLTAVMGASLSVPAFIVYGTDGLLYGFYAACIGPLFAAMAATAAVFYLVPIALTIEGIKDRSKRLQMGVAGFLAVFFWGNLTTYIVEGTYADGPVGRFSFVILLTISALIVGYRYVSRLYWERPLVASVVCGLSFTIAISILLLSVPVMNWAVNLYKSVWTFYL